MQRLVQPPCRHAARPALPDSGRARSQARALHFGAIIDVIVDMRPGSPTLGEHVAVELTADNHRALFIPPLFAHAFQTLQDATEVHYQVSQPYTPNTERGLRFDDPVLGIEWPMSPTVMSDKDRNRPLLGSMAALVELAEASRATS